MKGLPCFLFIKHGFLVKRNFSAVFAHIRIASNYRYSCIKLYFVAFVVIEVQTIIISRLLKLAQLSLKTKHSFATQRGTTSSRHGYKVDVMFIWCQEIWSLLRLAPMSRGVLVLWSHRSKCDTGICSCESATESSTVPVELCMNFSILFSVMFKQDSPNIWFLILNHTVKYIWFYSLICESADSNQHIFIVFIPETLQQSSTFCFLTHRKPLKNCEPNLNRLTESLLNSQTVCGYESHKGHKTSHSALTPSYGLCLSKTLSF